MTSRDVQTSITVLAQRGARVRAAARGAALGWAGTALACGLGALLAPLGAPRAEPLPPLERSSGNYVLAATFPDGADYVCFRPMSGQQVCTDQRTAVSQGSFTFDGTTYSGVPTGATAVAVSEVTLPVPFVVSALAGNSAGEATATNVFARGTFALPPPAPVAFAPKLGPAPSSGVIFADGFESGDASAWTSSHGITSYPTSGCIEGSRCGSKELTGGVGQQGPFWTREFRYGGDTLYMSVWFRFPRGYSWDGAPSEPNNYHHKLLILDTSDNIGRMHLNLSGSGSSPVFRMEVESVTLPSVSEWTQVPWPADGEWHRVELEVTRNPGPMGGRARVWRDGIPVMDHVGYICGTTCSPIIRAYVGAYVNQGAATTESFYVDDVLISSNPRP